MDGITLDQFNAAFGDLKRSQESQVSVLSKIEGVVTEKLTQATAALAAVQKGLDALAKTSADSDSSQNGTPSSLINEMIAGQDKQVAATANLNKTINQSFKALSSSFLTRDGARAADRNQRPQLGADQSEFRPPTKTEKQTLRGITGVDTKMGALLKEIQDQRRDQDAKNKGGLMGFLAPLLTLVGGFAVLSFAAMKFGPTRRLLEGIQKNGVVATLKGMLGKFAGKQKDVTAWLRSLPLVGRFFDIYDAFTSFAKGDWKTGLKHLAFAVPFGEDIIQILGGTTKQQFLAPGGAEAFIKGFSIKGAWERFKDAIVTGATNLFNPAVEFYHHIQEAFSKFGTGTPEGIKSGFETLAAMFPSLEPVFETLNSVTQGAFKIDWAKDIKLPAGQEATFGDVIKVSMGKVWDGAKKIFHTMLDVFMTTGKILVAVGDLFSSDYSKQSAALNYLDDAAPPIAGMMRPLMNIMDAMKNAGIEPGMDLKDQIWKVFNAKGSSKYSASATQGQQYRDLQTAAAALPEGKDKEKLIQQAGALQSKSDIQAYDQYIKDALAPLKKQQDDLSKVEELKKQKDEYDRLKARGWKEGTFDDYVAQVKRAEDAMNRNVEVSTGVVDGEHVQKYYNDLKAKIDTGLAQVEALKQKQGAQRKQLSNYESRLKDTADNIQEQSIYDKDDTSVPVESDFGKDAQAIRDKWSGVRQLALSPTRDQLLASSATTVNVTSKQFDEMSKKLDTLTNLMAKNNQLTAESADDITDHLKNMPSIQGNNPSPFIYNNNQSMITAPASNLGVPQGSRGPYKLK